MKFSEFKQQIELSVTKGYVEVSIPTISTKIDTIKDIIGSELLKMNFEELPLISESQINISGKFHLTNKVTFLISATFINENESIGHIFKINPGNNWANAASGEFKRILSLIPVNIESWGVIFNSSELHNYSIRVGERSVISNLDKGVSYFFTLKSKILSILHLDEQVFALKISTHDTLQFLTISNVDLSLGSLFTIKFKEISIPAIDTISLHGVANINFFGIELSYTGEIKLGVKSVSVIIPINAEFIPSFLPLLNSITLKNTMVAITGSIQSGIFSIGLSGDFAIQGSTSKGEYEVWQTPTPNTIPDLFQFQASRITMSDILTVMSGLIVKLPEFFDKFILLEKVYGYYASKPGIMTKSGFISKVGMAAHSDIIIFGYQSYGHFEAFADKGIKGKLLLNPLKFGTLLEISGNGQATWYNNRKYSANCIEFSVDTSNSEILADINIIFLKQMRQSVVGKFSITGFNFIVKYTGPGKIGDLQFNSILEKSHLRMHSAFTLSTEIQFLYQAFNFAYSLGIDVSLSIEGGMEDIPVMKVSAKGFMGGISVSFFVLMDPSQINSLEELLLEKIKKMFLELFKDASQFLKAIVEGVLKYTGRYADQLYSKVGQYMRDIYKCSVEETVVLMRKAEFQIGHIVSSISEFAGHDILKVVDVFESVGMTMEEIAQGLKESFSRYARETKMVVEDVALILKTAGYEIEKIIRLLLDVSQETKYLVKALYNIGYQALEVAKALKNINRPIEEVGEAITQAFYDVTNTTLPVILKGAGYLPKEVEKLTRNIFNETGNALENGRRELGRVCRNIGICN